MDPPYAMRRYLYPLRDGITACGKHRALIPKMADLEDDVFDPDPELIAFRGMSKMTQSDFDRFIELGDNLVVKGVEQRGTVLEGLQRSRECMEKVDDLQRRLWNQMDMRSLLKSRRRERMYTMRQAATDTRENQGRRLVYAAHLTVDSHDVFWNPYITTPGMWFRSRSQTSERILPPLPDTGRP
eukprot:Sspe_Gene.44418::Locus_21785_Transcript_1_1_Confidence_1.000_Length_3022::g.44418::m.44418